MIFFITSLRHTTVAHVAVIYATVPFVAAALGWIVMRERPTRRTIRASLAAFAGVVLMVGLSAEVKRRHHDRRKQRRSRSTKLRLVCRLRRKRPRAISTCGPSPLAEAISKEAGIALGAK